jgi:hypothetical protein
MFKRTLKEVIEEYELKIAATKKKKEKKDFIDFIERLKPSLLEPFIESWVTRCKFIYGIVCLQARKPFDNNVDLEKQFASKKAYLIKYLNQATNEKLSFDGAGEPSQCEVAMECGAKLCMLLQMERKHRIEEFGDIGLVDPFDA